LGTSGLFLKWNDLALQDVKLSKPTTMKKQLKVLFTALLIGQELMAVTIKVPQEQATIQAAIDAALEGDTILVDTGVYYENIVFRGKNIVLTSYYVLRDDYNVIFETIIDGSQPVSDTSNVVTIFNGENAGTVLEGFTITGGVPGVTVDLEGLYSEGGGLLIRYSSPEIKFNYFTHNGSLSMAEYNGGGGMSTSYSNSHIHNNIFYQNYARAGAAFIDNNSSVNFYNNLVVGNISTPLWGGIVLSYRKPELPADTSYFYNNTIVGNINYTTNDIGVFQSAGNKVVFAKNNIVYGNAHVGDKQITTRLNGIINADYNTFPEGDDDENNISEYPAFLTKQFFLDDTSPCIDAGDPAIEFLDVEDPDVADEAKFPSQGTLRNDQGCYGGPYASVFTMRLGSSIFTYTSSLELKDTLGQTASGEIKIFNTGGDSLQIDSITLSENTFHSPSPVKSIRPFSYDIIGVSWDVQEQEIRDTLKLYHNSPDSPNPLKIALIGIPVIVNDIYPIDSNSYFEIYPNPVQSVLTLKFSKPETGNILIVSLNGKNLKTMTFQNTHEFTLDVDDLNPGIYLIKVESGVETIVKIISVLQ
jgi:hypothetical protein